MVYGGVEGNDVLYGRPGGIKKATKGDQISDWALQKMDGCTYAHGTVAYVCPGVRLSGCVTAVDLQFVVPEIGMDSTTISKAEARTITKTHESSSPTETEINKNLEAWMDDQ